MQNSCCARLWPSRSHFKDWENMGISFAMRVLEYCGSGYPHGLLDLTPFDNKRQPYVISEEQK